MITNPTVFVLGAGASKHYDFPLGRELVTDIIKLCGTTNPLHIEMLSPPGEAAKQLRLAFSESLSRSGSLSIDEFLRRNEIFREVGTRAIAILLLENENEQKLQRKDEAASLYEHIVHLMTEGTENQLELVNRNRVTFITFNYDRSFEQYLNTSILHAYEGLEQQRVEKTTEHIPVLHVHGALGNLPHRAAIVPRSDHVDPIPYGGIAALRRGNREATYKKIGQIASNLRLIYDDRVDTTGVLKQSRSAMQSAEQVVFLGLSYGRDNLKRLIPNLFTDPDARYGEDREAGRAYFGSAMELGQQKIGETEDVFGEYRDSQVHGPGKIELYDGDCLETLRELPLRFNA